MSESDFKGLVVTGDSSVVLNQLHVDEQGTYRCSLQERNGAAFYRVTFLLTGRVQLLDLMTSQKNCHIIELLKEVKGDITAELIQHFLTVAT